MEDLALNHHSIRSLDEIVDYLVPPTDLLRHFRNGKLCEWLYDIGEDDKSNKVHELNGEKLDDTETLIQLIDALGLGDNAKGLYSIGKMYLNRYLDKNGAKAESDAKVAVSYFRKAADKGNAGAQYELAECWNEGLSKNGWVDACKSRDEALALYKAAAEQGFPDAQCGYGWELGSDGNDDCVYWWELAASNGCSDANYWLADCYEEGKHGIKKNVDIAIELYHTVVKREKDAADAMLSLARCYLEQQNVSQAIYWCEKYEKSEVDQDSSCYEDDMEELAKIQYGIGLLYTDGYVYPVHDHCPEAFVWYRKAAELGNAAAQYEVAMAYQDGDFYGITDDDEESLRWLHKAVEQGYAAAECEFGDYYMHGEMGFQKNRQMGLDYYKKAAKHCEDGNGADAILKLFNHKDELTDDELREAVECLKDSASHSEWPLQSSVLCELGKCYFYGIGMDVEDKVEAVRLYEEAAADERCSKAHFNLAVCLLNGWGVEKPDFIAAKYWAEKAANSNYEDVAKDAKALLRRIPAP